MIALSRMEKFEDKVMPVADKIANNRYLLAIRDGFMLAMPLLIIGAMSCLVAYFPADGFINFMNQVCGKSWTDFFTIPYHASMAVMTLFVVVGIANSLSEHYKQDGLSTAVIALVCFFVLTPFVTAFTLEGSKEIYQVPSVIPLEWIGSKGLFVGIFSAILATLIPGAISIFTFGIIRLIFVYTSFKTIDNFIYTILQAPLTSLGDSLGATLIANFFIGLFWIFGIAGADVVQSVLSPVWLALSAENLAAYSKGNALPHIITQQFNSIYLWIGGAGSTLALCLALLFVCKSQQCKKIGKLAILPGLFNINEPIIFGLPVVLNPIMVIPFIFTPLVLAVLTYFCMFTGLVPAPNGVIVPWTTPIILGGFLVSGIRGAILQIVEMVIAFFIYLPFIKIMDRQYCNQEKSYEQSSEGKESA